MEKASCAKCARPLILLLQSKGGPFIRLERRTLCASCRPQPLAHPCSVRGCLGAANNDRGARLCSGCYQKAKSQRMAVWQDAHRERCRAYNKASYEKHKESRLAQRRQRRLDLKQSKLKEQSCCTFDS